MLRFAIDRRKTGRLHEVRFSNSAVNEKAEKFHKGSAGVLAPAFAPFILLLLLPATYCCYIAFLTLVVFIRQTLLYGLQPHGYYHYLSPVAFVILTTLALL